uniref:Stc1 domain-containing protein n=1 Tax=Steinernema glaseri TaxID=37863 RepID=A0A1I7Z0G3_9BILA
MSSIGLSDQEGSATSTEYVALCREGDVATRHPVSRRLAASIVFCARAAPSTAESEKSVRCGGKPEDRVRSDIHLSLDSPAQLVAQKQQRSTLITVAIAVRRLRNQ